MNKVLLQSIDFNAKILSAVAEKFEAKLYALIDAAQDKRAIALIRNEGCPNECLFGYALDTPIAKSTPRLVEIHHQKNSPLFKWITKYAPHAPVATLIASTLPIEVLAAHLRQQMDVELQGLDSMFLAFWDPAILGTLVGQSGDVTLHVAGPIFNEEQKQGFLSPIAHWWYWSRDGSLHDAAQQNVQTSPVNAVSLPAKAIIFAPAQVDLLVEASVPDNLLHHIRQNQPGLLQDLPPAKHYQFVQQQVARARRHGLVGTGDLVNYVCVALEYGAEFDILPSIAAVLIRIKENKISFDKAMDEFSESDLQANRSKQRF
jgi:hypothetical protein